MVAASDLLEARQMQALSLTVHIPIVCFGIAFPAMMLFVPRPALPRSLSAASMSVQVSGDKSVILAVVTPQAGKRMFCAGARRSRRAALCKPRAIRGLVRQISVGEVYQLTGGSQASADPSFSRRMAAAAQSCAAATKNGEFTPQQLSTAYGVDPLRARRLSGAGVRVATLSSQEVDTSGFQTWGRCFHLRAPVVRQFAMPGASRDTASAPEETVLDIEALASLAPGLQRITPIFVPLDQSFTNSFLLFMFGALDPSRQGGRLPDILSISDGVCESRFTRDQLALGRATAGRSGRVGDHARWPRPGTSASRAASSTGPDRCSRAARRSPPASAAPRWR